jgi:hypothetical protein
MRDTQGELPSAWEMGVDIMAVVIVDEILFYYGHRLFHESKWLYAKVHKIHHEFQYPCGLVAAYSHPFEMVVCNVVPLGVGACVRACVRASVRARVRACVRACVPACVRACLRAWQKRKFKPCVLQRAVGEQPLLCKRRARPLIPLMFV